LLTEGANPADQERVNTAALFDAWPQASSYLVPLALSVLLAGAIGLERELHGRPAGLRTHVLVCLCATMLVHASLHLPEGLRAIVGEGVENGRLVIDPNRLSAGIVTGIGFLGAATVIRAGDLVRGVTTAACIWFVAGLGVVIGNGSYSIAIVSTAVALVTLVLLDQMSNFLAGVVYRRMVVRGHAGNIAAVTERVRAALTSESVRVQDVSGTLEVGAGEFELEFHLRLRHKMVCAEVLESVGSLDGVRSVEWSTLGHD
jgi:putative Mg2+ transporter-C (MgtC) family protein